MLKEVGPLLELLAGGVEEEEEGTGYDDEDVVSKEIVVDAENVVAKLEPASVGLG